MANGTHHYDEAERILTVLDDRGPVEELEDDLLIAKAQAEATLALAGAVAALIGLTVRGNPVVVKHARDQR